MNVGPIAAVTFIVFLMVLYQWPKMNQYPKKDKIVFISLTVIVWTLALVLIYFPDIPGPNKMVQIILEPLQKMISI